MRSPSARVTFSTAGLEVGSTVGLGAVATVGVGVGSAEGLGDDLAGGLGVRGADGLGAVAVEQAVSARTPPRTSAVIARIVFDLRLSWLSCLRPPSGESPLHWDAPRALMFRASYQVLPGGSTAGTSRAVGR